MRMGREFNNLKSSVQRPVRSLLLGMGLFLGVTSCLTTTALGQSVNEPGASEPALTSEQTQFFESKIRPALVEHCYRCHSNDGQGVRGGLMVDSREGLLGGGESGPSIVPGNLEDSLLWAAINHDGMEMPPNRKMPENVINDFRKWILAGAPDPRVAQSPVTSSRVTPETIEAGRTFWSFQPPRLTPPVETKNTEWARTTIDRYLLAAMESAGLSPTPDADPHTLARRIHFDLHGLPPSPEEVSAFVAAWKKNPDQAVSAEVDRLLEEPQYGERWGRHWLDVARYAESSGKEIDLAFPHAWRYRDYCIDSFNSDKPYDRFIQEQIAGDLLPVETDSQWTENLVATGFLAIGPKTLMERNPRQFQADTVDEQIDTATRVVLGISVACARCHDHKFDPIPQSDYYALAGIFQSTETFFGGINSQRTRQSSNLLILPTADPNPFDPQMSREELLQLKGQLETKERESREAQLAARNATRSPNQDPAAQRRIQQQARVAERELAVMQARINQVDASGKPLTFCMGVQDLETPVNAKVLVRGEINQPAQEVPRGFVQVISDQPTALPNRSSGRLELARWMSSRDNPLTSRVMVNRIWLHLFGSAIVAETDNFGASGAEPTHPELLDHLAIEFMNSGWSVKDSIRQMMSSRAYRLSTAYDAEVTAIDSENRLLSRANSRRLEAESIRDAMLVASNRMDYQRPRASAIAAFGPTILDAQGSPQAALANFRNRPTPVSSVTGEYRAVYLPISRNVLPRSLEVFDFAEPTMVVGQREVSNTATQSLYLLNNEFVLEQSMEFAKRILANSKTPQQAVRHAFSIAYSREPSQAEMNASMRFLKATQEDAQEAAALAQANRRFPLRNRASQMRGTASPEPLSAMAQFCHALFTAAEFRYIN